jgi:hypothetical protein
MGEDTTLSKEMGVTPTRSSNKEREGAAIKKGKDREERREYREQ